jgi:hypothetical protein
MYCDITKPFRIESGVKKGCSLIPYLFLLVGEVLNYIFLNDRKCKIIKGIKSFWVGTKQQTLSQYVNNTLISYKGKKENLHSVDNLLQLYLFLING